MHLDQKLSLPGCSALVVIVSLVSFGLAAPGSAQICQIKDNKKSAVVFTTDDGLLNSVKFYVSEWKKDSLRGTCAIISGSVGGAAQWAEWKKLIDEGYLDVGNHSMTHPVGGLPTLSLAALEPDVNGSKTQIETNLPGYHVVTFLCPEGAYNDQVINKIMEHHAANRVVDRGYNSFNPTQSQIYRLKRQQILGATTVAEMNGWIETAISGGQWLIEAYHGCDNEGWEPPSCANLATHYAYVATRRSLLWNGTFNEVIKYIRERQSSTLRTVSSSATAIVLQLTDTLDNLDFDFPLTLKTEVPSDWQKVYVAQGSSKWEVPPVVETNVKYAYFNVVPDKGDITLTNNSGTGVRPVYAAGPQGTKGTSNTDGIYTLTGKRMSADPAGLHPVGRGPAVSGFLAGIYIVVQGTGKPRCVFAR
jgi:oligosaccharide reducing-end xylanase